MLSIYLSIGIVALSFSWFFTKRSEKNNEDMARIAYYYEIYPIPVIGAIVIVTTMAISLWPLLIFKAIKTNE